LALLYSLLLKGNTQFPPTKSDASAVEGFVQVKFPPCFELPRALLLSCLQS